MAAKQITQTKAESCKVKAEIVQARGFISVFCFQLSAFHRALFRESGFEFRPHLLHTARVSVAHYPRMCGYARKIFKPF
jgi:hypothetical protein